jgi:hypothetical protein
VLGPLTVSRNHIYPGVKHSRRAALAQFLLEGRHFRIPWWPNALTSFGPRLKSAANSR